MAELHFGVKHPERSWLLWGILAAIILSAPLHFIYGWSGKITAVGILTPINESVWEHLKLAFLPMLVWWLLGYVIYRRREELSAARWFTASAAAMIICPLFIIAVYYIHTGAFAMDSLFLDILSLILGVIIAQLLGRHIYRYSKLSSIWLVAATILILLLLAAFIGFTFSPPHIPLFVDPPTGTYGINKP